ncbi:MAG: GtrA family protein [Defluviitaleaceae bacterium]|nr:GtrA family protein [Defluviitaleaceae bacterium]
MSEKIKKLWKLLVNRETIVYLVFGVLTTVISYVVFNVCFGRGLGTGWSNTISFIAAIIFAYPTNKVFVFDSRSWDIKTVALELASFIGARLFSFFLETGALYLLINKLGVRYYFAKIITSVVVVILNYIFSKFIFRKKKQ